MRQRPARGPVSERGLFRVSAQPEKFFAAPDYFRADAAFRNYHILERTITNIIHLGGQFQVACGKVHSGQEAT